MVLPNLIGTICYHYSKYRSKQKNVSALSIQKLIKIKNEKRLVLKFVRVMISTKRIELKTLILVIF